MIVHIHNLLLEWSDWAKSERHESGGIGKLVILRVLEGKGELLPGAPFCPKRSSTDHDIRMMRIERWVASLKRHDKRLMKTFYLGSGSVEAKAKALRLEPRELYRRIHTAHLALAAWLET